MCNSVIRSPSIWCKYQRSDRLRRKEKKALTFDSFLHTENERRGSERIRTTYTVEVYAVERPWELDVGNLLEDTGRDFYR